MYGKHARSYFFPNNFLFVSSERRNVFVCFHSLLLSVSLSCSLKLSTSRPAMLLLCIEIWNVCIDSCYFSHFTKSPQHIRMQNFFPLKTLFYSLQNKFFCRVGFILCLCWCYFYLPRFLSWNNLSKSKINVCLCVFAGLFVCCNKLWCVKFTSRLRMSHPFHRLNETNE